MLPLLAAAASQAGTHTPPAQPSSGPHVASTLPCSSTTCFRSGLHPSDEPLPTPPVPPTSKVAPAPPSLDDVEVVAPFPPLPPDSSSTPAPHAAESATHHTAQAKFFSRMSRS
jgi:hypothetical protein